MAVDDDDLLADGDHPGGSIGLVNGQAEGLALAEPGPRAEQDQQRIPARHSSGQGEYLGGQKIQVGLSNARKTAEVIVGADTRAIGHIQRRRAFELVSAQQHHSEVLAQLALGGVIPFSRQIRSNSTPAGRGLMNRPVNTVPLSVSTSSGTP